MIKTAPLTEGEASTRRADFIRAKAGQRAHGLNFDGQPVKKWAQYFEGQRVEELTVDFRMGPTYRQWVWMPATVVRIEAGELGRLTLLSDATGCMSCQTVGKRGGNKSLRPMRAQENGAEGDSRYLAACGKWWDLFAARGMRPC